MLDKIIDFDLTIQDINDVKIFMGKYDGIQRYDRFKYPVTRKLVELQQAQSWFPTELSYGKDKLTVSGLSHGLQDIYQFNLAFQMVADSLANRFLDNNLSDIITSPEWEAVIKWQAIFEMLHSESYSHNIREVYGDPEAFFNKVLKMPEIQKRLEIEIEIYKGLTWSVTNHHDEFPYTDLEKKVCIFRSLIAQYVLENVRFMVSFLYTFKINEMTNSGIPGTANSIALIANDENIHTIIFKHIVNILKTVDSEEFTEIFEGEYESVTNQIVYSTFERVIESELEWFDFLSSREEMDGMTREQIKDFLHHYANYALKGIGYKEKFERLETPTELIQFFEKRRTIRGKKVLAMENDNTNYTKGSLVDNDNENEIIYTGKIDNIINEMVGVKCELV